MIDDRVIKGNEEIEEEKDRNFAIKKLEIGELL